MYIVAVSFIGGGNKKVVHRESQHDAVSH